MKADKPTANKPYEIVDGFVKGRRYDIPVGAWNELRLAVRDMKALRNLKEAAQ